MQRAGARGPCPSDGNDTPLTIKHCDQAIKPVSPVPRSESGRKFSITLLYYPTEMQTTGARCGDDPTVAELMSELVDIY